MRIGSICSGYGGLDLAAEALTGGSTAWVSDLARGPSKVLAHRFPEAPNLGDLSIVDWSSVEPVQVLTGGTPCQDLSVAGKRRGMAEGTRSNLWVVMREAIATIRPSLVIWENVGGAYSAEATSDLEQSERLLGIRPGRPALRALGRVLGDLASLGYDAEWHGLRASDVGAPHGRLRVFVAAHPRHDELRDQIGSQIRGASPAGGGEGDWTRVLLPTLIDSDGNGPGLHGSGSPDLRTVVNLLPTPIVNDMGKGRTLDWWDEWAPRQKAADGTPAPHGKSLIIELQRLLPTPNASDSTHGFIPREKHEARAAAKAAQGINLQNPLSQVVTTMEDWGDYAEAILTWGALLGRPAPTPTVPGKKGPELSARFAEWMMGLPDGWVTDTPSLSNREGIKLCGNGVVPQQATAALRMMLAREEAISA